MEPSSPSSSQIIAEDALEEIAELDQRIDAQAIDRLFDLFGHRDPVARWQAGVAISKAARKLRLRARVGIDRWNRNMGEPSFTDVLNRMRQGLQDTASDPMRRAAISESLGEWDHEAAVALLITSLDDPEPVVRASAAASLGRLGDETAIEPLTRTINDTSMWVRRNAAEALGALGALQAIPALALRAHQDPQPLVRAGATVALGQVKSAKAREALSDCLQDPDSSVRWYAARSLGQIGTSASCLKLEALLGETETILFSQSIADLAIESIEMIQTRERGFGHRLVRAWLTLTRKVKNGYGAFQARRKSRQ